MFPIRGTVFSAEDTEKFAGYFRRLNAAGCEVIVIDGSYAKEPG